MDLACYRVRIKKHSLEPTAGRCYEFSKALEGCICTFAQFVVKSSADNVKILKKDEMSLESI